MYPVSKPSITSIEVDLVNKALSTGWISSQGPQVKQLEKEFAKFIGTKYAVACSSGTTALTLTLRALGVGPGDEVIVPEFTMVATAWAVTYLGATPVFVDCGDDLNINPSLIEEKITNKTRVILPVHIYGRMVNVEKILAIARKYGLMVIEDVCEAHGATRDGQRAGSFGVMGCFSLFANKIISSGEGGLITTNSEVLREKLIRLRSMYFNEAHTFLHPEVGYNFRMGNLAAAFALGQVRRINEILEKRQRICEWYDGFLPGFALPRPVGSVLWMYDIFLNSEKERDGLIRYLANKGIETRLVFKPMSMQPMYLGKYKNLQAYDFSRRGLYLPTYIDLTYEDVKHICEVILDYL